MRAGTEGPRWPGRSPCSPPRPARRAHAWPRRRAQGSFRGDTQRPQARGLRSTAAATGSRSRRTRFDSRAITPRTPTTGPNGGITPGTWMCRGRPRDARATVTSSRSSGSGSTPHGARAARPGPRARSCSRIWRSPICAPGGSGSTSASRARPWEWRGQMRRAITPGSTTGAPGCWTTAAPTGCGRECRPSPVARVRTRSRSRSTSSPRSPRRATGRSG